MTNILSQREGFTTILQMLRSFSPKVLKLLIIFICFLVENFLLNIFLWKFYVYAKMS